MGLEEANKAKCWWSPFLPESNNRSAANEREREYMSGLNSVGLYMVAACGPAVTWTHFLALSDPNWAVYHFQTFWLFITHLVFPSLKITITSSFYPNASSSLVWLTGAFVRIHIFDWVNLNPNIENKMDSNFWE